MVTKTYLSKYNTIVKDSWRNYGFAPVSDMVYGADGIYSRGLIYFDHTKIADKYNSKEMPSLDKMRHVLKIMNTSDVEGLEIHEQGISQVTGGRRFRAVSFDLIFFLIPSEWDNGKGFAYHDDMHENNFYPSATGFDATRLYSEQGSNWFQRRNGIPWEEEGIYSNETLSREYDKYAQGEESVIIARQKFDIGNESVEVDITDTVNKFITGELVNNGIGIAFTPMTELSDYGAEQYIGLMTNRTPTFFEPYLETRYDDSISDDRSNFVLNKKNRLYLYATIGSKLTNLDELPLVTVRNSDDEVIADIDGNILENIEAKQYSVGVYYIEFTIGGEDGSNTMIYDTWDNLKYGGVSIPSTELYATVKPMSAFFSIGNAIQDSTTFTPNIGGINEKERIKRGDVRKIVISPRPNYTTNTVQLVDGMEIRLYVMDGMHEYDVISWDKVEKTYLENYYLVDTSILVPGRYFVDVKISYGMNSIIHHDVLQFDIVSDITKKTR